MTRNPIPCGICGEGRAIIAVMDIGEPREACAQCAADAILDQCRRPGDLLRAMTLEHEQRKLGRANRLAKED